MTQILNMSDDKEEEINELLAEIELEDSQEGTLSPLESVSLKEDDLDEEKKKDDSQGPIITQTATTQPSSTQPPPTQPPPTQQPPTQPPPTQPRPTQRQPAIPDEVKEAAAMAATVTREAAADVAKEFTKISSQAQSFLSNMWSQFDPLAAQSGQPAGNREEIDVSERFGLVGPEKVLESFRCTLIQTYAPADNTFTPMKAIGFTVGIELDRRAPAVRAP